MATEKVGVYRKYYGAVPTDKSGNPLPKNEWPRERRFSWAVRWFGSDGKRFSKSFKSRKVAERFAETKQAEVRVGKGDQPRADPSRVDRLEQTKQAVPERRVRHLEGRRIQEDVDPTRPRLARVHRRHALGARAVGVLQQLERTSDEAGGSDQRRSGQGGADHA